MFAIKYLRSFGFEIDNEAFAENSRYFRNALARANYVNYSKDVSANPTFLEHFFENLLLGADHLLRNMEMHINYSPADTDAYANLPFGKSVRTVKRLTVSLSEKGLLKRENGKRNGFWKVIKQ